MAAAKREAAAMVQHQESLAEEGEEQRLRAALRHLHAEAGVLERFVYKHRNQHRGAAYFQYLIKVRKDLKLLLGSNLADIINTAFPVIAYYYCEAIQITFLLARSFFIELCTAVLALLARVRVLIQQMLLDVVSVYNKVTDLMDRKQAARITIDKVQAFREYYPSSNDPSTTLECVWVKDKFVLHEMTKASCQKTEDDDHRSCAPDSSIQYETLGPVSEEMENLDGSNSLAKQQDASLADQPDKAIHCGDAGDSHSGRHLPNENTTGSLPDALAVPVPVRSTPHTEVKPDTRKRVAFISVGKTKVTVTRPETTLLEVTKESTCHCRSIVLCNLDRTDSDEAKKKGYILADRCIR